MNSNFPKQAPRALDLHLKLMVASAHRVYADFVSFGMKIKLCNTLPSQLPTNKIAIAMTTIDRGNVYVCN